MKVVEIATREPVVADSVIEDLMRRMEANKVAVNRSELKRVDRSTCKDAKLTQILV